jgi:hypothetical protein
MSRHRRIFISLFFSFLILSLVSSKVSANPTFTRTASNEDQIRASANFTIRFVYDFGLFQVNLATAWGSFSMYDKVEGENVTTFYGFSNMPRFESGTTLLGRPLVQGIAVGEYWLAHVYVFKNGTVIRYLPEDSGLYKRKLICGGIWDAWGCRDVEIGRGPFWGPEIGEGWGIGVLYSYKNSTITTLPPLHFNREDIAGVHIILYLFDTYLVFSDGTYSRPGPRQYDYPLMSIIAVEQEFNITDSGWTAGRLTLETRNFTQTHFDPVTKTLTIYVNHLPDFFYYDARARFYYDAVLLIGSVSIISLISVATFVLVRRRRSKSKQAAPQTGDLQATEFR